MSRRTTGNTLIAIAAFLYAAHFLAAAMFGSNVASWDANLFRAMLQYTDQGLSTASLVALIAGIIYLVWAELPELFKKRN